jgi:hypothetical protein
VKEIGYLGNPSWKRREYTQNPVFHPSRKWLVLGSGFP